MAAHRRFDPSRPPRVRHEPPTLAEAFAAARDLADNPEHIVEIAAGLMGIAVDQARLHFVRSADRRGGRVTVAQGLRRPVVVERRRRSSHT